jgi:hypothetical protein
MGYPPINKVPMIPFAELQPSSSSSAISLTPAQAITAGSLAQGMLAHALMIIRDGFDPLDIMGIGSAHWYGAIYRVAAAAGPLVDEIIIPLTKQPALFNLQHCEVAFTPAYKGPRSYTTDLSGHLLVSINNVAWRDIALNYSLPSEASLSRELEVWWNSSWNSDNHD